MLNSLGITSKWESGPGETFKDPLRKCKAGTTQLFFKKIIPSSWAISVLRTMFLALFTSLSVTLVQRRILHRKQRGNVNQMPTTFRWLCLSCFHRLNIKSLLWLLISRQNLRGASHIRSDQKAAQTWTNELISWMRWCLYISPQCYSHSFLYNTCNGCFFLNRLNWHFQ